jgi:hypothetical protein
MRERRTIVSISTAALWLGARAQYQIIPTLIDCVVSGLPNSSSFRCEVRRVRFDLRGCGRHTATVEPPVGSTGFALALPF